MFDFNEIKNVKILWLWRNSKKIVKVKEGCNHTSQKNIFSELCYVQVFTCKVD